VSILDLKAPGAQLVVSILDLEGSYGAHLGMSILHRLEGSSGGGHAVASIPTRLKQSKSYTFRQRVVFDVAWI